MSTLGTGGIFPDFLAAAVGTRGLAEALILASAGERQLACGGTRAEDTDLGIRPADFDEKYEKHCAY
ncbi:hypothetical protein [Mycobacterium paraense]|uniref:hypothetical protein n=1 Tax=Mycobacterium paraense TaxID=767916 RepID=UPI00114FF197|nr:hypothetical protein [Mycobacterium paraense]